MDEAYLQMEFGKLRKEASRLKELPDEDRVEREAQYEKRLQYPINIKKPNAKLASFIISQYGGPDGELGASLRYLSQRYSMKDDVCKGLLTDIGLSAMILLLYIRIGKAYCFQHALPFSLYYLKV